MYIYISEGGICVVKHTFWQRFATSHKKVAAIHEEQYLL